MTFVNGLSPGSDVPDAEVISGLIPGLAALLGQVHDTLLSEDWDGLRPSHLRFVSAVPDGGANVTELAELAGLTKQGCGQYVAHLRVTGHLKVGTIDRDRRVRRISRTPLGDAVTLRFAARVQAFEDDWADLLGRQTYDLVRHAMTALVNGG